MSPRSARDLWEAIVNESVTTVQVGDGRWVVLENALPVGTIGTDVQRGRGRTPRTVWVVFDAGQGVPVDTVRGVPYVNPAGAVQAVLEAREAHERAQHVPGLTDQQRRVLDFEAAHWAVTADARLARAERLFGLDRARYLALVADLVDSPPCREYAPHVVDRLAHLLATQPRHRADRSA